MSKIYDWKNCINETELENVVENLKENNLVILPTETVYGFLATFFRA